MSKAVKNGSEPAYPLASTEYSDDNGFYSGLTKREHFAALAMQALLTATFTNTGGQCVGFTDANGTTMCATGDVMAKHAVMYADALLVELSKGST